MLSARACVPSSLPPTDTQQPQAPPGYPQVNPQAGGAGWGGAPVDPNDPRKAGVAAGFPPGGPPNAGHAAPPPMMGMPMPSPMMMMGGGMGPGVDPEAQQMESDMAFANTQMR